MSECQSKMGIKHFFRRNRTVICTCVLFISIIFLWSSGDLNTSGRELVKTNSDDKRKQEMTIRETLINAKPPLDNSKFLLNIDAKELMERQSDERDPGLRRRLPNCIIIGAAKCGTEAIQYFLQLHPDISTELTENNFFAMDNLYSLGYDWLRSKMPRSYPNQTRIHRGTWYWDTPGVPSRILSMNKNTKLILLVCEPVRRVISWYTHFTIHSKNKTIPSFDDHFFYPNRGDVIPNQRAVRSGRYLENINRWLKFFKREQLLVICGEDFRKDPFPELVRIEKFLGLAPKISSSNIVFSQSKKFYCKFINGKEECLSGSKGRVHVTVAPEMVEKLKRYFKPHNEQFYNFTVKRWDWD